MAEAALPAVMLAVSFTSPGQQLWVMPSAAVGHTSMSC
jgi:hypothetical protein